MCAEFMIRADNQKILRSLGLPVRDVEDETWDFQPRLYSNTPVVFSTPGNTSGGEVVIRAMGFSLKPRDVPYPTFNARLLSWDEKKNKIVSAAEKPTWREPLRKHRCVVPMNGFIEPVYKGSHAGEMVLFEPQVPEEILFCAAIHASSVNKETGEVYEGFSLILHTPSRFVVEIGHHRQPVFLRAPDARKWIEPRELKSEDAVNYLLDHRYLPELQATTSRKMAKGWEKRVKDNEKKFESEIEFAQKLEKNFKRK